ncbi:glycosyltransferase family 2 protein [candidate division WOR-3 bacterium]|nr:glycosyltransferase family 2 protein [candidate division WOR-3 bacterium]
MKICAVVVTYNRKVLLEKCLNGLLNQIHKLDKIIVIDNGSKDGTDMLLCKKYGDNSAIEYIKLPENTGCAGGFYEGIKRAYEQKFDWIWTMDDEGVADSDCLEKLLNSSVFKRNGTGALTCKVLNKDANLHYRAIPSKVFEHFGVNIPAVEEDYKKSFFEVQRTSFIGLLLKREVVKKAGLPMRELFMGGDDTEYIKRISKVSKIYLVPESIIFHYDDVPIRMKTFMGIKKIRSTPIERVWLGYYSLRNSLFLGKRELKIYKYVLYVMKNFASWLFVILFCEDHKLIRLKFVLKALIDGIKGNLGKTINPEEISRLNTKK